MLDYEEDIITGFSDELVNSLRDAGYPQVDACIQCGTCSGGCPSGKRTALKVRNVIRKVQLGLDEILSEKDIWLCSTCYTCLERCPRKIPITDIIIYLRNLAVQKGFMHKNHLELCKKLFTSGHGVPIDDKKWNDFREFYGLDRVPPTVHSHPEDLEEVKVLLASSNFNKLINIPFKKKEKPKSSMIEETIPNYLINGKIQTEKKK
ncbi:MAG: CoB--CoM heterodisulfide reductase subunit C [Promethearchaeota archaeon]